MKKRESESGRGLPCRSMYAAAMRPSFFEEGCGGACHRHMVRGPVSIEEAKALAARIIAMAVELNVKIKFQGRMLASSNNINFNFNSIMANNILVRPS